MSLRSSTRKGTLSGLDYPPPGIVAPDEVFPFNSAWAAHRWYRGWTESILPAARFDAKSTELALAQIFEASAPT